MFKCTIYRTFIRKSTLAMKAYFISGIGADYRLFTHIRLPEGFETHHVQWIPPDKEETLPAYAQRLAEQIDSSEPFVLIGFSLGGIMAVEIAKLHPPVCTIIISSIPLSANLPPFYILADRLRLSKLAFPTLMKLLTSVYHLLTMRSHGNWKIMRKVIWSGDSRFISWAINAVLKWENAQTPQPLVHIHGTSDEIFPFNRTRPTHTIPKGNHNLTMSHPHIINNLLRDILTTPAYPVTQHTPIVLS
jgi:pimeloyl-ACP methyl ester carboxylesterase